MPGFLKEVVGTATTLFFIVDPIGAIPSFLVMTANIDHVHRKITARKASLYCCLILISFCVGGTYIFELFGIGMAAFRLAGGIVLGLVGLDMLRAYRTTQEGKIELLEGSEKDDVAITPLAIPMLAGPGALSTVMMLASQKTSYSEMLPIIVGITITCGMTYIVLRCARKIHDILGKTGIRILTRVMGLLIMAIAVQYILDGVKGSKSVLKLFG